jgi:hypothetical protein
MEPAMGRLLPYEALYFGFILLLLCSRKLLVPIPHGVDEKLLTNREAHGKRIEERGAESIAVAPVSIKWGFQVYQQATDDKIGHDKAHKE